MRHTVIRVTLALALLPLAACGDPSRGEDATRAVEQVQQLLNAPGTKLSDKLTEVDVLVPGTEAQGGNLFDANCGARKSTGERGFAVDCRMSSRSVMEIGRGVPAIGAITLLDVVATGHEDGVTWAAADTSTRDSVLNSD